MFTGLIEEVGRVTAVRRQSRSMTLAIEARIVAQDLSVGDSICVDGACQTVTSVAGSSFVVEALAETMRKTTLGLFAAGRSVNLERSLLPGRRLGGHFVQGHVNGTGLVMAVRKEQRNVYLSVRIDADLARTCIAEGSIAIDGVSLTIAELRGSQVTVNVIPHTLAHTTLRERRAGDRVNVETDLVGRHVERLLGRARDSALTQGRLESLGW